MTRRLPRLSPPDGTRPQAPALHRSYGIRHIGLDSDRAMIMIE